MGDLKESFQIIDSARRIMQQHSNLATVEVNREDVRQAYHTGTKPKSRLNNSSKADTRESEKTTGRETSHGQSPNLPAQQNSHSKHDFLNFVKQRSELR